MCYKTTYITVRLDLESESIIDEDVLQEVISELDCSFSSRTPGVNITDTKICGINI